MPIFDKTISIRGKHGAYMIALRDKGFFDRNLDVYLNAAIIGFFHNRKGNKDTTSEFKGVEAQINFEQVNNEMSSFVFTYRLILLLDNKEELDLDSRINRAFKDDSLDNQENHIANFKVFNSYVLGGIELLYEKILEEGSIDRDFIKNAYQFMKEEELTHSSVSPDDLLNKLT